jgi:hypothetical protein
MAQTLGLRSSEAGPSSFVTSQDFISFNDFEDDAGNDEAEQSDESAPQPIGEIGDRHYKTTHESNGNAKVNGKKRKTDDRIELEGKSKKEKKREVARGTPWCEHVDFERCITSADV